jgi:hypothetical protein
MRDHNVVERRVFAPEAREAELDYHRIWFPRIGVVVDSEGRFCR